ncbi:MAG: 2-C-methyl-D-erythritol 4-phosphate cytidylyltransferase, partial [Dehalococcoidales bacterium]
MSIKISAIIVAAGGSERMAGIDKMFALINGRTAIARVIDTFQSCKKIDRIVVVINSKNIEACRQLAALKGWFKVKDVVPGGKRRQD